MNKIEGKVESTYEFLKVRNNELKRAKSFFLSTQLGYLVFKVKTA